MTSLNNTLIKKKEDTLFVLFTYQNINRFSKFFHH